MVQPKKQDIIIGNGSTKTPILASANAPTEAQSQPVQQPTSIESGSTKPLSVPEALSLLQTLCFDLRSMGCELAILANKNRIYIVLDPPASIGKVEMKSGHITINNKPVSNFDTGKDLKP
jgi:hypothetical protein